MIMIILPGRIRSICQQALLPSVLLLLTLSSVSANVCAADALYFSLMPATTLPAAPSSLIIPSPTYINVPAGAKLSLHLMRGDVLVSTSTLSFGAAYSTTQQFPPVPIASFVPPGMGGASSGQPLPNATLTAGEADLARVAAEPSAYRLLWVLSAGEIAEPRSAYVTGGSTSFTFVDLRLSAVSAATIIGDQKPGSVLFYSRYTSNASNPGRENTTFNITNTNPAESVFVRVFLVDGVTCQTDEIQICLAARQTARYSLSDLDPGVRGYIVAVATNQQGQPIQFNWLTGNAVIKQPGNNIIGSYSTLLSALAVAKRNAGAVTPTGGQSEMIFDDTNYDRLPGQIAFDGVPSQSGGSNATNLSFYRPTSTLAGAPSNISIQVTAWGQDGDGTIATASGNTATACYSDVALSNFRLTPRTINQLLPAGTTGWLAASASDTLPLLGVQLNSGEYNSGNNGRALTFSTEYRIRVPIVPVTCPQ
jgi:hypothetical protein